MRAKSEKSARIDGNKEFTILSWNVNGFRSVVSKGFYDFFKRYKPDVLCLQEIKQNKAPELPLTLQDYDLVWNPAKRKGYAGTALFFKKGLPLKTWTGLGVEKFDVEGRVINAEFEHFFLVNAYFPNAQHGLPRLGFKLEFNNALLKHVQKLRKKKPVIICGDFNVAHKEIDLANPKQNVKNPGFTIEEREWMDKFLSKGFIDTFRVFHPNEPGHYSWWTYRFNARARNIGWRIDYVVISKELLPKLVKAFISKHVYGSDHAPVGIVLKL